METCMRLSFANTFTIPPPQLQILNQTLIYIQPYYTYVAANKNLEGFPSYFLSKIKNYPNSWEKNKLSKQLRKKQNSVKRVTISPSMREKIVNHLSNKYQSFLVSPCHFVFILEYIRFPACQLTITNIVIISGV